MAEDLSEDVAEDDTYRSSCYDCGYTPENRHLPRHPVIITHDEGMGYEEVPVPLCGRCRGKRFGYPCPRCGATHNDEESARYCCQRAPGEAPDCPECGRRMTAGAKGYDPDAGPSVEWAECDACGVGWGRFTGWHDLDEEAETK